MLVTRCYLRVSTEDQAREGYSLGAQRDRLAAFAASQGWKVAEYYVDEGISAKDMNRPALKRLLNDIQRGEVVLVYRLDRLTRNVSDLDHLLRKWESTGVLFRSCTEDFNTTTAAGRLFIRLVADLAQWERENLGERVRMGLTKRAQEGDWAGGPAPFGYACVEVEERTGRRSRSRLVPNESAPVVKELFEKYLAGQGMRSLTLWLNREKGLKGPRGGSFSDTTVSQILGNPVYAGLIAWNRRSRRVRGNPDAILAQGKHEAIVTREIWEQAQLIRERRRSLPPRHATGDNIFAGIGRCGLCGGALEVVHTIRPHKMATYRCGNYAAKGTCTLSSASAARVEEIFLHAVRELAAELTDASRGRLFAEAYLREQQGGSEELTPDEIRRQLSQTKQAIAVWDTALEQGRIGFTAWQDKTSAHYIRQKDLEAQLVKAEQSLSVDLAVEALAEHLRNFDEIWNAATNPERKTIAISFFKEVRVYPGRRVEIVPRL